MKRIKQYFVDTAIIARNFLEASLPLYRLRRQTRHRAPTRDAMRFLIMPSDPAAPSGSMGEMAMLTGLVQSLKSLHPDARFTLIGTRPHEITIQGAGTIDVVPAWQGTIGSRAFDRLLREHHAFFGLGADVLDGKYGASLVCRFVAYCNHAACLGIPATITGFSFNSAPRRPAVHALSHLHPDVRINVRDQFSLQRFSNAVRRTAELCADIAFLMAPSNEPEPEIEHWIREMRIAGRIPVGVNMNAHAFAQVISETGTTALVESMTRQLAKAAERDNLAYLLIPHDVKPQSGDIKLLQLLDDALNESGFHFVHYALLTDPARIKRATGLLDMVITGRMHLAIAALGMETPILSISYQDKFEGLYRHFRLSDADMISPCECLTDSFSDQITKAISRREDTSARIAENLPHARKMAEQNLILGK